MKEPDYRKHPISVSYVVANNAKDKNIIDLPLSTTELLSIRILINSFDEKIQKNFKMQANKLGNFILNYLSFNFVGQVLLL